MKEDLLKMGLTKNEVSVYLSLLYIGETAVGEIIKDLKFHRQVIYNALDSLENKNMVIKTIKNSVNNYKIADPVMIVENIEKKELIAKRLSKNIKQEMKKGRKEHEINVYEGRVKIRNFIMNKYKKLTIGSTFYALSNIPNGFVKMIGEDFFYNEHDKMRRKRKIKSKHLGIDSNRKEYEIMVSATKTDREIKYLPDSNLGPIAITIFDDCVLFSNYGSDAFLIEVKNKEIRDSYKKHFDMLWMIAKK